jgi:osmoprotectant transport system substrate-binding protein
MIAVLIALPTRLYRTAPIAACVSIATAIACSACGSSISDTQTVAARSTPTQSSSSTAATATRSPTSTTSTTSSATTAALPGTGKPTVTIGDKNYTEQFVLGQLYSQALQAQGFTVQLNQNIGPTDVTVRALQSGLLGMYPEYLNVFNSSIARYRHGFRSQADAYRAAERYAVAHGLQLLAATPFSDTNAVSVTVGYARANRLRSLTDLPRVASQMTLGGPPLSEQTPPGLAVLENAYGFTPKAFTPLAVGAQYSALINGSVQAAEVQTTDGQLADGDYRVLSDPQKVFGWGNVVPVVSARALSAEGPAFADTIDKISAVLTTRVIRQLNQAVDISGQSPAMVAHQFLVTHGLIPISSP